MNDETSSGSSGASDGRGPSRGSVGKQCPLQTRAAFLKNWGWELVVSLNRGACQRGSAQHGINSETGAACQSRWENYRLTDSSLLDTLDFLRSLHKSAPFLFFNGNTFADIGRRTCDAIFSDLPALRRRELASAVAHYIAGVLDRDSMISAVDSLWQSASLGVGDRVQTMRGTTRGVVTRILEDGRIAWRPEGSTLELLALPESLLPVDQG